MRIKSFLNPASTRLTFFLIGFILLILLISAIIPQQGFAEEQIIDWKNTLGDKYVIIEKLGLDRIYYTPSFYIILFLFSVNLTAVNVKRFRLAYKIEKTLIKAKYLGSIIFHFSLLLIIAGIILNYLYKFNGVFALTEGQNVSDSEISYFRIFSGPLRGEKFGRFDLSLEKVYDDYKVDNSETEAAEITMIPAGNVSPLTALVYTNQPFKWNDLEFHFGLLTGYSPEVILQDSTGKFIFRNFVRLATRKIGGEYKYSDYILIPGHKLKLEIEVIPGGLKKYDISVSDETEMLYEGVLSGVNTARFDKYVLTIPRLRRWCYIDVVESPFLNLVFTGFWTAIGGLAIGLVPRLIDQMRETK